MGDAANTYKAFNSRLKSVSKRKARLERGYQSKVSKDGLIVFKPKRLPRGTSISARGVFYLIFGFFLFKGMIMAHIGGTIYGQRVATLQEGTVVEQVGGFIMHPDAVTQAIATQLRPFLK
jgi:hypothetical protein